jgi:hypothetical protein
MLLSLVHEGGGVGAEVLTRRGLELSLVAQQVLGVIPEQRRPFLRSWTIPARDAGRVSAMLWAWSTCPECRDRRWTG